MAENTKIQWTDHTFNPWRGCSEVNAECDNCYARTLAKRNPAALGVWGPNGRRVIASEAQWRLPVKWNREAEAAGVRRRVFSASLSDVFEDWQGQMLMSDGSFANNAGTTATGKWTTDRFAGVSLRGGTSATTMDAVRSRLFRLIDATPNLDWQLVTKRPENVLRMWPVASAAVMARNVNAMPRGRHGSYRPNVWLLTSISDQETADAMIPRLLECRELCPVLGLSAEPLLGPVTFRYGQLVCPWCDSGTYDRLPEPCDGRCPQIKWVIIGGESGPGARPCNVDWIRSLVAQCREAGVPAFVKQLGADIWTNSDHDEWPGGNGLPSNGGIRFEPNGFGSTWVHGLRDKKAGEPSEWPADLRVREFPRVEGIAR